MRTRTGLMISMVLLVLLPPALALAGGGGGGEGGHGGGHGASLKEHGYYLINFLVFLGLLYVLAGDSIKAAVRERSRSVGKEILEAGEALDAARGREEEAKTALDGVPARTEEIQETFAAEGARLAQLIKARTETETVKIRNASKATAEAEHTTMRRTLSRELAEKTLNEAEKLIEARTATMNRDQLFDDFIGGLAARAEGEQS
jgi:F-type H+-transporting ATPase subunit b